MWRRSLPTVIERRRQPLDRLLTRLVSFALVWLGRHAAQTRLRRAAPTLNRLGHQCVFRYLRRYHGALIASYAAHSRAPQPALAGRRIAWVSWWQGEEAAPALIKLALTSLRRNLTGVDVRVVTASNFRDYSTLSPALLSRLEHGDISATQFSDALRMNLIHRHGGIWIDASVLAPVPVPVELFDRPFYTLRAKPEPGSPFVSHNRWTGFLVGGAPGQLAFAFVNDLLEEYWANNRAPVNYFLIDFGMALAYQENIGGFRQLVDDLEPNNPDLYALASLIDQPFDSRAFAGITPPLSPTWFFKLNRHVPLSERRDGRPTFFGHLRGLDAESDQAPVTL